MIEEKQEDIVEEVEIIEQVEQKLNALKITKYARGALLNCQEKENSNLKIYYYKVTNLDTNKVSALKIINKRQLQRTKLRKQVLNEIKIHRELDHSNLVKLENYFENKENIFCLLELCINKSLMNLMAQRKQLSEFEVQYYIYQISIGLKYMHNKQIIHGDLNLDNILLDENLKVKISNFSLSKRLAGSSVIIDEVQGTPNFAAPELLVNRLPITKAMDVWSLGVIMFSLLCGKTPFEHPNQKVVYELICNANYEFVDTDNKPVSVSKKAQKLITQMLVVDPTKRIKIEDVLSSEFINNGERIAKQMHVSTLKEKPDKRMIQKLMCTDSREKMIGQLKTSDQYIVDYHDVQGSYGFKLFNQQLLLFHKKSQSTIVSKLGSKQFCYIGNTKESEYYLRNIYPYRIHKKKKFINQEDQVQWSLLKRNKYQLVTETQSLSMLLNQKKSKIK